MADKLIKVKRAMGPSSCCIMAVCISMVPIACMEVMTVIM